ncbi:MAG: 2OG-Fe(II) oxygenase [Alphaproteobacteria bacterium]|nr:2OG-Fe(II) oxygenase [Alphaproteobacteria bacterium]
MTLTRGDLLPNVRCASRTSPRFPLDALGGDHLLMVFLGSTRAAPGRRLLDAVLGRAPDLLDKGLGLCLVTVDPRDRAADALGSVDPRVTVLWDEDRAVFRRFGLETDAPDSGATGHRVLHIGVVVATHGLRFRAFVTADPATDFPDRLSRAIATLPPREVTRPAVRQAPVLQIPEVFDRGLCRRLIAGYESTGGTESGFMRDQDGKTRGVLDPRTKRRRDCMVEDEGLRLEVREALIGRAVPEIAKAFAFEASRIERYLVACYDAADRGFFNAHRDNVSRATAHRRFAMSINLNSGGSEDGQIESDGFAGGALCFPEYGPATFVPAPGDAVVFSCSLLHAAQPVTKGRRFVFLTFFYDEAAARIRQANRHFLDTESTERAGGMPNTIVAATPDAPAAIPGADATLPLHWASVAAGAPSANGPAEAAAR